jgi:hypothetical protein
MGSLLKSLAPKTLVMDGTMGGLDAPNRYPAQVLESGIIDIFSNHYYYGQSDYARIKRDADFISKYDKAFILGEFGFDFKNCKAIYDIAVRNTKISGAMVWSLRYHSRDGGFYVHQEDKGFSSFHVPGFPPSKGFGQDDERMAKMVREQGWKMQGVDPKSVPAPVPPPCKPAYCKASPAELVWFGSAWAASYLIYKRENGGEFKFLVQVIDNKLSGSVLYSDTTATKGVYEYMIQPVDISGKPNIIDPLILKFTI